MKIISLLASPHGLNDNTAGLLQFVLDGARAEGAQTETVVLKGGTLLPCLGCDNCHKKGRCARVDDFEPVKEKIMASDGLVLASPNYIFNVSAQLKAFMDRCCGVVHCMSFWGKYGASVVTSGGGGDEAVTQYIERFPGVDGRTARRERVGSHVPDAARRPFYGGSEKKRPRAWKKAGRGLEDGSVAARG